MTEMEFLAAPLIPILGLVFLLAAERLERGPRDDAPADSTEDGLAVRGLVPARVVDHHEPGV